MARTKSCDNGCGTLVLVDHYGDPVDESTPHWFTVRKQELTAFDVEANETNVVDEEVYMEFCSGKCAAEQLTQLYK